VGLASQILIPIPTVLLVIHVQTTAVAMGNVMGQTAFASVIQALLLPLMDAFLAFRVLKAIPHAILSYNAPTIAPDTEVVTTNPECVLAIRPLMVQIVILACQDIPIHQKVVGLLLNAQCPIVAPMGFVICGMELAIVILVMRVKIVKLEFIVPVFLA